MWKLNKEKLFKLRSEKGWTQEDATEKCKIYNVRQYIRLENGETKRPRSETLENLASGFELSDVNELTLINGQKPSKTDYDFYLNNKNTQSNILNYKLNPDVKASKLIVLGVDNTILKGYNFSWKLVCDYLKIDDKIRRDWIRNYQQNKISYNKWIEKKANLLIENKLNKNDFKFILKDVYIISGFKEFISYCKDNDYALAIVSGGIDTVLEYMMHDYKQIFDYVTINKFIYDRNGDLETIIPTPYDFKNKADGIVDIQTNLNIAPDNTVSVAGGYNNIHTLQASNTCIAIDTHSIQLREGFNHYVSKPDLREVIPFLK